MARIAAKASAMSVAHVLSNLDADGKPVFRMSAGGQLPLAYR